MLTLSMLIEVAMLGFAVYVAIKNKASAREYALAFIIHELVKFSLLLMPFVQQALGAQQTIIFFWIGLPMIIGLVHSFKTKTMIGRYVFVLLLIFLLIGASPIWKWLPFGYLVYMYVRNRKSS